MPVTTLFDSQISECHRCGQRVGVLTSRTGKPYFVALIPPVTPGQPFRARTNGFHDCPRRWVNSRGPAVDPVWAEAAAPAPAPVEVTGAPLTDEQLVDLWKSVHTVMGIYVEQLVRSKGLPFGKIQTETVLAEYCQQMRRVVSCQVAETLDKHKLWNDQQPPSRPASPAYTSQLTPAYAASSLDAVVAATTQRNIPMDRSLRQEAAADLAMELDNAGGPEPIPASWVPSDEDVPF